MANPQHYGPNAFDTQNLPPQAPDTRRGFRHAMLNKTAKNLGFQRAGEALCASMLQQFHPTAFQQRLAKDSPWNATALEVEDTSLLWQLYYILCSLAWAGTFIVPFFVLASCLVIPFWGGGMEEFIKAWVAFGLYIWLPCFSLWFSYKLCMWGYLNPDKLIKPRKRFTLSRQSGLLHLYDKTNQRVFRAPFVEFDPWRTTTFDRFGVAHFGLILIHRYKNVPLNLTAFITHRTDDAEVLRLWCMLQRYMDISQPMPDILPLEAARAQDPTTAAFDKARNPPRPERFWRDMSETDYQTVLDQMRHQFSRRNDFGHHIDIFQGVPAQANTNLEQS